MIQRELAVRVRGWDWILPSTALLTTSLEWLASS